MGLETLNNCFGRSGRSLTLWMGYDIIATITSYITVIPASSFCDLYLVICSFAKFSSSFEIRFKCMRWFWSNLEGSGPEKVTQVLKVGVCSRCRVRQRRRDPFASPFLPCLQLICTDFVTRILKAVYLGNRWVISVQSELYTKRLNISLTMEVSDEKNADLEKIAGGPRADDIPL